MIIVIVIAVVLLILFFWMVRFNSKVFDVRIERIYELTGDMESYEYLKSIKDGDQKLLGKEVERIERLFGIHHKK